MGGLTNTVGGVVGAAGRGLGETVSGATGGVGKDVGKGIAGVGNGESVEQQKLQFRWLILCFRC